MRLATWIEPEVILQMSNTHTTSTDDQIDTAQEAALQLAGIDETLRDDALKSIAAAIKDAESTVLSANEADVTEAESLLERGEYTETLVDRLRLSPPKLADIAEMVESVADLEDPLGRTEAARELDDGLELFEVTVPIGVVAAVFESRPDALVQIASLALKSGNAVILKGGSEASESNRALFECIRDAATGMPDGWIQLIEAREDVDRVLARNDAVDLVMPRGSSAFVSHVQDATQIPVLGHTEGVCHVYVDGDADLEMAADVAFDAKVQYPAVCNAVETLLVNADVAGDLLPGLVDRYESAGVTLRGDERTRSVVDIDPATDADWETEYGDLELAIKIVDDEFAAIRHVNQHGSKHTESIITDDSQTAETFMTSVDAASVFHNASTRFADGHRYGLGAEVGISTGKIHARGPVGLGGLTSTKYYLEGDGHLVATYSGEDAVPYTHRELSTTWTPGQRSNE